jgi:hypothetical protein
MASMDVRIELVSWTGLVAVFVVVAGCLASLTACSEKLTALFDAWEHSISKTT